ncbi:MAG: hypothetical protein ACXABI_06615 [Candidatus Hodarchaeales archaeon]|jgi:hypothetical protein
MTVSISLTITKQTEFFNEYVRNKILQEILTAADIIDKTEGNKLNITNMNLGIDSIGESMNEILPGGRHTLFLLAFPVSDLTTLIIKPYNLRLKDVACHYASVEEFDTLYRNLEFPFEQKQMKIMVSDVFGLGVFSRGQTEIPFIIQRYSQGTKLTELVKKEHSLVNIFLPMIFKHLAKEGIVIDPYPQNWYVHRPFFDKRFFNQMILEYIDLAFFHSLQVNKKIKQILESLKPFHL